MILAPIQKSLDELKYHYSYRIPTMLIISVPLFLRTIVILNKVNCYNGLHYLRKLQEAMPTNCQLLPAEPHQPTVPGLPRAQMLP
jgi:hypothetical protein